MVVEIRVGLLSWPLKILNVDKKVIGYVVPISLVRLSVPIQKVAHNLFINPIDKNNKIPPIYAVTINLCNKQFLLISFSNDDNHITPSITKNQPIIIKIATGHYHSITVLNKWKTTNIGKLFHIELWMFITLDDDRKAIKNT